jgi:hypothetical protein
MNAQFNIIPNNSSENSSDSEEDLSVGDVRTLSILDRGYWTKFKFKWLKN